MRHTSRLLRWWSAAALACAFVGCSKERQPDDASPPGSAQPEISSGGGGEVWGANYFPNIPLTTHHGKPVRFFDDLIKGRVVAINFIYTTCTDACPMETARMIEVQKLLSDRLGKDVFFYSITIDPERDTPERLAAYAASWKVGDGWTFLTGKEADITLLRKKLGVYDPDTKKKDHNLSLVIGNQKTGRWMKRSPYENAHMLASQLGGWLHNWKMPSPQGRDYANAPELRSISGGEDMFRTRCSSCHTIGGGDRTGGDGEQRIGPDLLGVGARRDRDWLVRWVMHPDKMLEAKDPIAVGLLARYNNIPMPNLRLTATDANAVLQYIEEEGALVAKRNEHASKRTARLSKPVDARAVTTIRSLLLHYEQVRAGLAADDLGAATTAARELDVAATAAATTGDREMFAALAELARRLINMQDIEEARLGFGELSRAVITVMTANPSLRTGQVLFRCTMARGYQQWIQPHARLANPYWGSRMLRCGDAVDVWAI